MIKKIIINIIKLFLKIIIINKFNIILIINKLYNYYWEIDKNN